MEEAIDRLWENRLYDEKVKNLYRRAVMDLNKIFLLHGIRDVFVKKRAVCWINYDNVDCDYYTWIEETAIPGSENSIGYKINTMGGYMVEYSWAEETNARISRHQMHVDN